MSTGLKWALGGTALLIPFVLVVGAALWAVRYVQDSDVLIPAGRPRSGDLIADGGTVDVLGDVSGDLTVRAASLKQVGAVGGDVRVQAAWTELRGEVDGSVDARGGIISLYGQVNGDVTLRGGQLKIMEGSVIMGDLVVTGGSVTLYAESRVEGDVRGHIVSATIESEILGNVDLTVWHLTVTQGASISGNLAYQSRSMASIDDRALIGGLITHRDPVDRAPFGELISWHTWALPRLIAMLLIGGLLVMVAPRRSAHVADQARRHPVSAMLTGLGVCLLAPVVLAVIALFVFTIPLVTVGSAVYLAILYGSMAVVGLTIGRGLLRLQTTDAHRTMNLAAMVLGVVTLAGIRVLPVPYIDAIVAVIVAIAGMGSLVQYAAGGSLTLTVARRSTSSLVLGLGMGVCAVGLAIAAVVIAIAGVLATLAMASRSAAFSWQVTPNQLGLAAFGLAILAISTMVLAITLYVRAKPRVSVN